MKKKMERKSQLENEKDFPGFGHRPIIDYTTGNVVSEILPTTDLNDVDAEATK